PDLGADFDLWVLGIIFLLPRQGNVPRGCEGKHVRVLGEPREGHLQGVWEPAPEKNLRLYCPERGLPLRTAGLKELVGTPGVLRAPTAWRELEANKSGPCGVVVVVHPVGEHQPNAVVLRALGHSRQKCRSRLSLHPRPSSLPTSVSSNRPRGLRSLMALLALP